MLWLLSWTAWQDSIACVLHEFLAQLSTAHNGLTDLSQSTYLPHGAYIPPLFEEGHLMDALSHYSNIVLQKMMTDMMVRKGGPLVPWLTGVAFHGRSLFAYIAIPSREGGKGEKRFPPSSLLFLLKPSWVSTQHQSWASRVPAPVVSWFHLLGFSVHSLDVTAFSIKSCSHRYFQTSHSIF